MSTARRRWIAAAIVLAWRGLSIEAHAASPDALPKLEVTSTPRPAPEARRPGPPAARARARGATLVLNSLSEDRRRALAHALDRVAVQLEARRNPFFAPLDEDATRAELKALLLEVAPAFAAAETLAAGRWTSPEGDLTVRLVGRCASGAACFPLAAETARGELENRARFLAWPIGYAILLDARTARDAARIAGLVRAARAKDSRIALVVSSGELHRVRGSAALAALERAARRALRAGGDRDELMARLLGSVVDARRAPDDLSWLELPPGIVMVVPRLGALATADAFIQELSVLLGGADGNPTWLSAPRRYLQ